MVHAALILGALGAFQHKVPFKEVCRRRMGRYTWHRLLQGAVHTCKTHTTTVSATEGALAEYLATLPWNLHDPDPVAVGPLHTFNKLLYSFCKRVTHALLAIAGATSTLGFVTPPAAARGQLLSSKIKLVVQG